MKILVGFDGSISSSDALKVAEQHAKAFKGRIELVTSMEKGTEAQREEIEAAEKDLEKEKKRLKAEGIPCQTHLLIRGLSPGEDLIEFAEENEVEEIVIGIRKKSKVGKLVFGSTAQFVILTAGCPVVTVK